MLILKPNCELCDCDLAADDDQAMICSYECTFCRSCVEKVLHDVCPNCGGNFSPRPIRPADELRPGTGLVHHPASSERITTELSTRSIESFCSTIKGRDPRQR